MANTTQRSKGMVPIVNVDSTTEGERPEVWLASTLNADDDMVRAVGAVSSVAAGELTRPANTTAYAAKDAVSDSDSAPTLLNFANVARENGGSGYIVKARLFSNQSTLTARFRLHLFHTAPTPINDNSPYTLLYANRANRIGYIDFPAAGTEGSGSDAASSLVTPNVSGGMLPLAFVCADNDPDLYGMLEALDAFTPASGQKFYIELDCELN